MCVYIYIYIERERDVRLPRAPDAGSASDPGIQKTAKATFWPWLKVLAFRERRELLKVVPSSPGRGGGCTVLGHGGHQFQSPFQLLPMPPLQQRALIFSAATSAHFQCSNKPSFSKKTSQVVTLFFTRCPHCRNEPSL
jgi:hypothetical protein